MVGVTAASKAFFGLSGPVRAMILLNLGSALFGSNQVASLIRPIDLEATHELTFSFGRSRACGMNLPPKAQMDSF